MYNDTSLGYYTMIVSKKITEIDARCIVNDFQNLNNATNGIHIINDKKYPDSYQFIYPYWKGITWSIVCLRRYSEDQQQKELYSDLPLYIKKSIDYEYIQSLRERNMTAITERYIRQSQKSFSIKAHINLKTFLGIQSYITEANIDALKIVEQKFNQEVISVSSKLGEFSTYNIERGKYSINFDLDKLNIMCSSEQMLLLLNQCDLNFNYDEYLGYQNELSHGYRSPLVNLTAKCDSIQVMCCVNNKQLSIKNKDNRNSKDPRKIIQFVVMYNYKPNISIQKLLNNNSGINMEFLYEIFSDNIRRLIICDCYNWTIMQGDYYTYDEALKIIRRNEHNVTKQNQLINVVNLVYEYRGVSTAKMTLGRRSNRIEFHRTLQELKRFNINPVCVPDNWNIDFVQNLLDAHINGTRRIQHP